MYKSNVDKHTDKNEKIITNNCTPLNAIKRPKKNGIINDPIEIINIKATIFISYASITFN
jgi:hypothetical protein